jgi:hypothetical protein
MSVRCMRSASGSGNSMSDMDAESSGIESGLTESIGCSATGGSSAGASVSCGRDVATALNAQETSESPM